MYALAVWDMGPSSMCASNFVQLLQLPSNGERGDEVVKRTFCGGDVPAIYVATANRLVVRFKKTVNFSGTGWLASFMAVQPNATPSLY